MRRSKTPFIYRIAQVVTYSYYSLFHNVEHIGLENTPTNRGYILAPNHASYYDPPLIGCNTVRTPFAMGRKTLFKPGLANWVLRGIQTIPVDRDGGSDVAAMKRVLGLLKQGAGLVIFPEGTRSKDGQLQQGKAGVGLLACKTQVPVVPIRIFGADDAFKRGSSMPRVLEHLKISVVYGPPIEPEEYDVGKKDPDRYQKAADAIMEGIAKIQRPVGVNV